LELSSISFGTGLYPSALLVDLADALEECVLADATEAVYFFFAVPLLVPLF